MTRGQQVVFCDDLSGRMLSFRAPEDIIVAETAEDFIPALQRMEAARASGRFLAGYMSYEAGFLLEPALASLAPARPDLPFLCFGIFGAPEQAVHGRGPTSVRRCCGGSMSAGGAATPCCCVDPSPANLANSTLLKAGESWS